jgi:UDP-2,3-diacylglucosamine hydrolase
MILITSDIHLSSSDDELNQKFLSFLTSNQPASLYILGDLFDFWLGDDAITAYHREIITALRKLAESGTDIYFICGNRDFLVGKEFAASAKLKLLPDYYILEAYGKKRLLLHGDTLCTDDTAYMQFRSLVRNNEWQQDFLSKSITERIAIAEQARDESEKYGSENYGSITDYNPDTLKQTIQQYQVEQIIHGHTHRPKVQKLLVNNKIVKHIVLGAWHKYAWWLQIDETGEQLIANF